MTRYIACSCNSIPHCADWGNNGLICFGTCNAIAIYEPGTHIGRVTCTLHRHRDHVNAVQWIKPADGKPESEILSSSADGTVIIWSQDSSEKKVLRDSAVLEAGSSVQFADSLQFADALPSKVTFPRLLICTGSLDGELKLWLREEDGSIKTIQCMLFKNELLVYGRLAHLPGAEQPLLAVAHENFCIVLYVRESNIPESTFVQVQRLTGHEDWVKCMEFAYDDDGSILLATGSQDKMIRLWKIERTVAKEPSNEFQLPRNSFTVDSKEYDVTLESILSGHEDWIYGLHWQPSVKTADCQAMRLLSSSMDKSMIIWQLDDSSGIWMEKVRVGIVGGNSLGFYGCKFSPDGLHILGHDFQGSFHIWKYSQKVANWIPRSVPGGHSSEVVDLCWDPKGRFLVTASKDQTTRIHAPWKDGSEELWHEIARPQVHGYDMACLTILAPHMYASGAEEKVVRIFTATSAFRDCLKRLADVEDFEITMAHGATVPSLGLMNKATFDEEVDQNCEQTKGNLTNGIYRPPTEEELVQNTLWPELKKLYGHGYEIYCMAAKHDGRLLATACRSTSQLHAAILLWSTDTWLKVQELISHQLTVTQLAFSPNDKYLLSVSRDRRWSLFKEEDGNYVLVAISLKKDNPHKRIIWCCSWTRDSNYFATGSRDGKICVWSVEKIEASPESFTAETFLTKQGQSVTALCFAPIVTQNSYILAIGYEVGCIEIHTVNVADDVWSSKVIEYDTNQAHHLTVKRLTFRPTGEHSSDILQLASCASDHAVKIHDINLSSLSINS